MYAQHHQTWFHEFAKMAGQIAMLQEQGQAGSV
jgi:hypothetical protein